MLVSRMVTGVDDPSTRDTSGVRSIEDMDRVINDLTSKFVSMSTTLDEIRSTIVGDGNRLNHEKRGRAFGILLEVQKGFIVEIGYVRRNDNHYGYKEKQGYRVKAEILTLLEILILRWC
ncbi:hypothetical protein Tco_1083742 [Tanacetum coccineum]